jgi:hypothetical protein
MPTISKRGRMCLATVITFYMSSVCLSATSKDELSVKPTAKELVNLYKKAVTCWDKSVAMRVEVERLSLKKSMDETNVRHWTYDITHRRDGDKCEWFGNCHYKGEDHSKDEDDEYSINEKFKNIVGDDFVLYYIESDFEEEEQIQALIESNVKEKLFLFQAQNPDGGFLQGRMEAIGSAPKMVDVICATDSLHLIGQEMLNGLSCFIVEAKTKYGTFTVWIAPEKGYNALKYVNRRSSRDILKDDSRLEDQGITEWVKVVDSIEVQKIDGVFVPISGKLTEEMKSRGGWVRSTHVEAKRSEIVLNPDFKALGVFKISFPEGTEVTHQDIPGLRFRWTNGKFIPDMNKYLFKNLTGKPLPSFERIITGFDPNSITGKMVLVSFFDMNQRPSRNCIQQLSKRAQSLKANDVVIVSIQSSKIDKNTLNKWIEEQNISFPVGIIESNEEETRSAWGVKSLPWLILTNKEHIVRVEGFVLAELDEKLKSE